MDMMLAYVLIGIYGISVAAALIALGLACVSDYRSMTIPNRLPMIIATAFVFAWGAAWILEGMGAEPRFSHLHIHAIAFGIMFALTFAMFIFKIWGGGDSKLASAVSLWIGARGLPSFLLAMALTGLALAIISYAVRFLKIKNMPGGEHSWLARLIAGEKVIPYGIAIAAGTTNAFLYLGYMDVISLIQEVAGKL